MSALIHWQHEAREFKYNHAPMESERARRLRRPIYSRLTSRSSPSNGFHRRRNRRT